MVVKVQETCNINCSYCYMYNRGNNLHEEAPASIPVDVIAATANFIVNEFTEHEPAYCRIVLHGGEPMLMPARRMEQRLVALWSIFENRLSEGQRKRISLALQTNATLVNDAWVALIHRWNISVGVSIDGPAEVHNRQRVDFRNAGTHSATLEGIQKLSGRNVAGHAIPFGGLCVIDPLADGARVYRYLVDDIGLTRFDFLLPFMTWENYSTEAVDGVTAFLLSAFSEWRRETVRPTVRLFESALQRLSRGSGQPDAEGNLSNSHFVVIVESDGSISPEETLRETTDARVTSRSIFDLTRDMLASDPEFGGVLFAAAERSEECNGCALTGPCASGLGIGRIGQRFHPQSGYKRKTVYCDAFKALFIEGAILLSDGGKNLHRIRGIRPDVLAQAIG